MRGFARDKVGKVAKVNYNKVKVYVEGISKRTARGKEVLVAIEPSNLLLLETEMTKERKEMFKQEASKQEAVSQIVHEKIKVENPKVVGQES